METNDIIKKFKEKICPHCIHYGKKDYMDCNIVMQIDGEANCIKYKCDDYIRNKKGRQK